MNEKIEDLESKVSRAEAKVKRYRVDLEAMKRAREILTDSKQKINSDNNTRGEISQKIRETVLGMSGEFGSSDVLTALEYKYADSKWDRATIATILRRLTQEENLEEISKGKGRTPGKFCVKTNSPETKTCD